MRIDLLCAPALFTKMLTLSSAKNKIPRFWPKPEGICGMIATVTPAARIFFQLIADFVVYLGLLVRPIEDSLDRAKSLATPSQQG